MRKTKTKTKKRQQMIAEIDRLVGRRLGLIGMHNLERASTERLEAFLATAKEESRKRNEYRKIIEEAKREKSL